MEEDYSVEYPSLDAFPIIDTCNDSGVDHQNTVRFVILVANLEIVQILKHTTASYISSNTPPIMPTKVSVHLRIQK